MWTPVPWAVGGGALITVDVGRLLAFASTGGAEGIVNPTDLKVQALATPGTSVSIAPGSALIRNRYANVRSQTYVADNPAQHTQPVRQTASGQARTDLVIARVYDPQFGGQNEPKPAPGEAQTFQYVRTEIIEGVPANADHAYVRNLGYPAIPLARIAIPAGTATITNAMITDMRSVANPRSSEHLLVGSGVSGLTMNNSGAFATFPGYNPSIAVPEWATQAVVLGSLEGVNHVHPATVGEWRLRLGSKVGGVRFVDLSDLPDAGTDRVSLTAVGVFSVGDVAGTTVQLGAEGRRTGFNGYLATRTGTQMIYDIRFREIAF